MSPRSSPSSAPPGNTSPLYLWRWGLPSDTVDCVRFGSSPEDTQDLEEEELHGLALKPLELKRFCRARNELFAQNAQNAASE